MSSNCSSEELQETEPERCIYYSHPQEVQPTAETQLDDAHQPDAVAMAMITQPITLTVVGQRLLTLKQTSDIVPL